MRRSRGLGRVVSRAQDGKGGRGPPLHVQGPYPGGPMRAHHAARRPGQGCHGGRASHGDCGSHVLVATPPTRGCSADHQPQNPSIFGERGGEERELFSMEHASGGMNRRARPQDCLGGGARGQGAVVPIMIRGAGPAPGCGALVAGSTPACSCTESGESPCLCKAAAACGGLTGERSVSWVSQLGDNKPLDIRGNAPAPAAVAVELRRGRQGREGTASPA